MSLEEIGGIQMENTKEVKQEPMIKSAVVVNCNKLNIRKRPFTDADIIGIISKDTNLTVNEAASTEDFYKVKTENGMFGYCMKKYVDIRG